MKEHQFRISKEIHTEGKQCQCRKCGNFGLLLYKNTWRNHFQRLYIHMSCLQCAIQERNHINARNAGSHFQGDKENRSWKILSQKIKKWNHWTRKTMMKLKNTKQNHFTSWFKSNFFNNGEKQYECKDWGKICFLQWTLRR